MKQTITPKRRYHAIKRWLAAIVSLVLFVAALTQIAGWFGVYP